MVSWKGLGTAFELRNAFSFVFSLYFIEIRLSREQLNTNLHQCAHQLSTNHQHHPNSIFIYCTVRPSNCTPTHPHHRLNHPPVTSFDILCCQRAAIIASVLSGACFAGLLHLLTGLWRRSTEFCNPRFTISIVASTTVSPNAWTLSGLSRLRKGFRVRWSLAVSSLRGSGARP